MYRCYQKKKSRSTASDDNENTPDEGIPQAELQTVSKGKENVILKHSMSQTLDRDAGGGGAWGHPSFGISVNPIWTKGGRLCPPYYYWAPHLLGQCGVSASKKVWSQKQTIKGKRRRFVRSFNKKNSESFIEN